MKNIDNIDIYYMKALYMKYFSLVIFFVLTSIGYGQTDSELICKKIDEFDDSETLNTGSFLAYADGGDMKTEGMFGTVFISESENRRSKGELSISTFYLKVLGIGCIDSGSTLDIIFDNGEKTQLVNWNDFDCEGENYFRITNKEEDLFKSSNIKAVKFTNKRNYKSMIIKENIEELSSFIKDVLLEIDQINNGSLTLPFCAE